MSSQDTSQDTESTLLLLASLWYLSAGSNEYSAELSIIITNGYLTENGIVRW